MKRLAFLTGLAGLVLLTALILHEGWSAMLQAVARAGWPLLWLAPAHLVPLLLDTLGWRALLEPYDRARHATLPFLLWVAAVREAVARLLPAAGIGGEVVGIRLCRIRIADTTAVSATVIVEVLVTMVVQTLFCALGIALIAHIATGMRHVGPLAAGLLLSLPLPVLVYLLLRHGAVFARIERWAMRLLGEYNRDATGACAAESGEAKRAGSGGSPAAPASPGRFPPAQAATPECSASSPAPLPRRPLDLDGARLDAEIRRLFGAPWRLARTLAWQFAGYLVGAFETWFALRLLGHPVGIESAIAIEALTQAARHATFMVPGGLGVQEAAVMLFGYLAGVGTDVALSLALIKRVREILFGVPVLLSWHWTEARRFRAARLAPKTKLSDPA